MGWKNNAGNMVSAVLVSTIVPVCNSAAYLRRCLDSLCGQDIREIEIICVNDGCTDDSAEILREYAARDARVVILEQENAGQGAARNLGLAHARGEYVAVVDPDDYVAPDFLGKLYCAAKKHDADVAYSTDVQLCMPDGSMRRKWMGVAPREGLLERGEREAAVVATGVAWNKLYRRSFIEGQGLAFYDRKAIGEDKNLVFFATLLANRVACVPDATYYDVQREGTSEHTLTAGWVLPVVDEYRAVLDRCAGCRGAAWLRRVALRRAAADIGGLLGRTRGALRAELLETAERLLPELAGAAQLAPYRYLRDTGRRVFVTLTSYPARTGTVAQTVRTLLNQTFCPDAVLLWLAAEQYPGRESDLPAELLELRAHGLEIRWTRDLRSYTKLIPALREYPGDILVTVDDDVLYPEDCLATLVDGHMCYPECICARRCHGVGLQAGHLLSYAEWRKEIGKSRPRFGNFLTGVGGVLYPPHCLSESVTDESRFMELCPRQDDIWFWAMALEKGTRIYIPRDPFRLDYVEGTQECGLFVRNMLGGENDSALAHMAVHYPELLELLRREQQRECLPNLARRMLRLPCRAVRKLYGLLRRC